MISFIAVAAFLTQDFEPMREIEELRREIEFLRTLNSLEVTKEQLSKVVAILESAKKKADAVAAEAKEDLAALKAGMEELRDALLKGEGASPDRDRDLGELHRPMGEIMRGIHEAQETAAADLKAVFTERQWKKLGEMNQHGPIRPMRERMGQFLDRASREDRNPEGEDGMLEHLGEELHRMAKPLGLTEKDADEEAERVVKILREALECSGDQLAEKRDEFLRRIFEEGKLGEASKRMAPPAEESERRIATMFSNVRTLALLKKKLENMK